MSHRFSASVAARYTACPASANLELAIPNWEPPVVDPDAGAKGRGTMLHEVAASVIKLKTVDMRHLVQALDYVQQVRERRRFNVWTEHTMQAHWLASQPWTTADVVLHTQDELHVIDLKFGKIPVETVGNHQLMFYGATYAPLAPKAHEVHLHVAQPPAGVFEEWVVPTRDLAQFMLDTQAAEAKVLAGDTTFNVTDHCHFCPAYPHSRSDKGKPLCPAAMQMLYPPVMDEAAMFE